MPRVKLSRLGSERFERLAYGQADAAATRERIESQIEALKEQLVTLDLAQDRDRAALFQAVRLVHDPHMPDEVEVRRCEDGLIELSWEADEDASALRRALASGELIEE